MKPIPYILPLLLLAACAAPKVVGQRTITVEGNKLQITSGSISTTGRYVTIENVDKQWAGKLAGGKEKWQARATLLNTRATHEILNICGEWVYQVTHPPVFNMMDKDETMGGMAPVLGITASMAAHLAASSATDAANVPVSVHVEFTCRKDER